LVHDGVSNGSGAWRGRLQEFSGFTPILGCYIFNSFLRTQYET
jgi:hypothetical protein